MVVVEVEVVVVVDVEVVVVVVVAVVDVVVLVVVVLVALVEVLVVVVPVEVLVVVRVLVVGGVTLEVVVLVLFAFDVVALPVVCTIFLDVLATNSGPVSLPWALGVPSALCSWPPGPGIVVVLPCTLCGASGAAVVKWAGTAGALALS